MKEKLCTLGFKTAVDIIDGTERVYYKHGVWNKYKLTDTEIVKKSIMNSGYGADIYKGENESLYVSIPSDSDMW